MHNLTIVKWPLLLAFALSICCESAAAQSLQNLVQWDETRVISSLSTFDLGDVDGDGCDDVGIVAQSGVFPLATFYRRVVVSGKTGQTIYDVQPWSGQASIREFVKSGDLDGDGMAEVAYIESVLFSTQLNVIRSSAPGQVSTVSIGFAGGGQKVSSVGDLTGDGVGDWAVTRLDTSLGGVTVSAIDIIDGANMTTSNLWELFNVSLTPGGLVGIGDVDGDGVPDIAASSGVNSLFAPQGGSVSIFSGQTGQVLRTWIGQAGDLFGHQMVGLSDMDGDGAREVAVFSPFSDVVALDAGRVQVFSTSTGLSLLDFQPGLGEKIVGVVAAGDHNGDGIQELGLFIKDTGTAISRVELRSGASGAVIYTFLNPQNARIGGDFNGDRISDILTFAPNQPAVGQTRFSAFSLVGALKYGDSPGAPAFDWEPGVTIPTQGAMALTGAPSMTAIIGIVSFAPANTLVPGTPFPLFVSAAPSDLYGTFSYVTDALGEHRDLVNLAQPGLEGIRAFIQYGVLGNNPITTNAIEILFGP